MIDFDDVSFSYDSASAAELNAGHWNSTIYGKRYIALVRMVGAGPVQIGGSGGTGIGTSVSAWPGVIPPTWG